MDVLPEKLHERKVSEVFLDYCKPLLEGFAAEGTTQLNLIEKGLRIPWMVWNSVVLDKHGKSSYAYLGSMKMHLRSAPSGHEEFIAFWVKRKKEEFSKYDYLMGEYHIRGKDIYDFILRMEAKDPGNKESLS